LKDIVLSINRLTKRYGSITAVSNLDLEIERGAVFGILGPNGSGKTTTLGVLLDVTRPDSGTFSWFGGLPEKTQRKRIGAILEVPLFYPYLSGRQNLELVAKIKDLPGDDVDEALKTVDLYERRHSKFRTYSLGMKQRLAVASTLIGKPEVLILDEPTNGLDPRASREVQDRLRSSAAAGKTIFLSTHLLDMAERLCGRVGIIHKGEVVAEGTIEDLRRKLSEGGGLEEVFLDVTKPEAAAGELREPPALPPLPSATSSGESDGAEGR